VNKPIYEIVKVLKSRVFVVGLNGPWDHFNVEYVYKELKKQFPNKSIIFTDTLDYHTVWHKIYVDFSLKVEYNEYNENKMPKIEPWDKILK
jgi:hypothetical protein